MGRIYSKILPDLKGWAIRSLRMLRSALAIKLVTISEQSFQYMIARGYKWQVVNWVFFVKILTLWKWLLKKCHTTIRGITRNFFTMGTPHKQHITICQVQVQFYSNTKTKTHSWIYKVTNRYWYKHFFILILCEFEKYANF